MTSTWLQDFTRTLRSMAPTIETAPAGRMSRVAPNTYYSRYPQRLSSCYQDVHCYAEKGIGSHHDQILPALEQVCSLMKSNGSGSYNFNMYWFGAIDELRGEDGSTNFLHRKRQQIPLKAHVLTRIVCDVAGSDPDEKCSVIPTLSHVGHRDLAIVFCRAGAQINSSSRFHYHRNRAHYFWFFLGGEEPDFAHGARFQPDLRALVADEPVQERPVVSAR